jgi:hypothetical protein
MKLSNVFAGVVLAGVVGAAGAGQSAVLYSNGPINGTINAWTINYGYAVSDSFTLTQAATVTGVDFGVWAFPGDTMTSVDWGITSAAGTYPITGTATVNTTYLSTNGYGYDLLTASFSLPQTLAAGTYYLALQNASASNADPIYWDENNGPSAATENTLGPIGSQAFTVYGSSAPEPATWGLMLAGLGLAGYTLRRRRALAA